MKESRNIILTFDYEPYLGAKSGTAQRCMLEPTGKLRTIMNRYNAKGIFFVDTLYLLNIRQHSVLKKDYEAITTQLKTLHSEGHYIFPHIHPHWLDAVYSEDEKQFSLNDISRYSLADFPQEIIKKLFTDSLLLLKEIGISYSQWGYRAGGWCIQPFSQLKDIFIWENIYFDFSVVPGCKNDSKNQSFDFSSVTKKAPYRFSDTVEQPDEKGVFIEFPVSSLTFNPMTKLYDKIIRKYLWKTNDRGWGDGIGAQATPVKFNHSGEMISIELLNSSKINGYKQYIKKEKYMHWLSHPKMVTRHGLKMFDTFMKFVSDKYELIYDFYQM